MTDLERNPDEVDSAETSTTPLTALESSETTASPGRVRGMARKVLRAVVVLVVVGILGVGVYFGWPVVYDRYIRPVEANTADLTTLERQLEEALGRITELEDEAAASGADLGALVGAQADTAEQVDRIAAEVDEQTARLDALDELSAGLATGAGELRAAFEGELTLLRSMELLSRARLFLYQANYGLAAQDLMSARTILAGLEGTTIGDAAIEETVFRLDLAIGALPGRPVAASDDLDIAWQALLGEHAQPTPTPTVPEAPTTTSTIPTTTTP